MTEAPVLSVVVPTFERRDVVLRSVEALAAQRVDSPFEAIVVVDGSSDGTAAALRALRPPFPLLVLEQPNRGAAAARNAGAARARGGILLFLDDDMEAAPDLLAAHLVRHRDGAEAVVGHVPLHPDSGDTVLPRAVGAWAEERLRRLSRPGAQLAAEDLLTGQLSVRRSLFEALSGFDERFTAGGSFGNEDLDLGIRLAASGARIEFAPEAVSRQRYVVTPRAYLRQWRDAGRADVRLARKHPERAAEIFAGKPGLPPVQRWTNRLAPGAARAWALLVTALRPRRPGTWEVLDRARLRAYWQGVREAGGVPARRPFRVLCFHSLTDLGGEPVLEPYGIPPGELRRALRLLARLGFRFLHPEEVVRYLDSGAGVPRRSLLLTFDDAFRDLVEAGLPVLGEARAPAVAFAVSRLVGGTNAWDEAKGLRSLPLADAEGLRTLARDGVEIGSHSRTHRALDGLGETELDDETAGAADELAAMGLARPRFFAYPYGVVTEPARSAVGRAGYRAGFTIEAGLVRPESDRLALPRIEIFRRDRGWRLLKKVVLAGRDPWSALKASLLGLIRP